MPSPRAGPARSPPSGLESLERERQTRNRQDDFVRSGRQALMDDALEISKRPAPRIHRDHAEADLVADDHDRPAMFVDRRETGADWSVEEPIDQPVGLGARRVHQCRQPECQPIEQDRVLSVDTRRAVRGGEVGHRPVAGEFTDASYAERALAAPRAPQDEDEWTRHQVASAATSNVVVNVNSTSAPRASPSRPRRIRARARHQRDPAASPAIPARARPGRAAMTARIAATAMAVAIDSRPSRPVTRSANHEPKPVRNLPGRFDGARTAAAREAAPAMTTAAAAAITPPRGMSAPMIDQSANRTTTMAATAAGPARGSDRARSAASSVGATSASAVSASPSRWSAPESAAMTATAPIAATD